MYWRMFKYTGQMNSLATNGISYTDFRKGYFFCVYDLSTSSKSGAANLIPSVRVGHIRTRVQFNEPLPLDITMLVLAEFPAVLFISKSGKIGSSFL